MKIFKFIIFTLLIISIILLSAFAVCCFFIWRVPVSYVTTGIIIFLLLNIAFSLISLAKLKSGENALVSKLWISYISFITVFIISDYLAGQFILKHVSPLTRYDNTVHHELIPGTTSVVKYFPDYETEQHVNSIGCRGKELSRKNDNSPARILMLGDSFTMGKGVEDNETFSVLLESMLN